MTASDGNSGFGATLAGTTTTSVGQLRNISFPGLSVDDVDISNMDSPDAYKEFVAGMIDGGTVEFEGVWEVTDMAALYATAKSRVAEIWTITFPDSGTATFTFTGYINSLGGSIPYDGEITMNGAIKITGEPVHAA